jgi:hypothetical protein
MPTKSFAFLAILFSFPLFSTAQFRKYSNEFLNIGSGARGLGMGGAQVASVQDGTAGYWNPAGLTGVKDNPQLNIMHAEYFAGIGKFDYASAAFPIQDNKRTLGISLLRFAVDDIPNTLYLLGGDGKPNFNNITTFSSADYALLLSYAQTIKENDDIKISLGGNAKIIHRNVGKFATAWGFGIDAGLQIEGDKWRIGVVARDASTTFNAWSFKFTDRDKEQLYLTKNDIPVKSTELTAPRLIVGGSYKFEFSESFNLLAEANLNMSFDGKANALVSSKTINIDPNMGIEAGINDVFFIRAGINNFQQALKDGDTLNVKKVWIFQPSLGAGFRFKQVMIDYAYTNLANQSNPLYTHIFSLKINLARKENN